MYKVDMQGGEEDGDRMFTSITASLFTIHNSTTVHHGMSGISICMSYMILIYIVIL